MTVSKDNGRVLQLLARRKGYLQDLADFAEGGWDEPDELDGLGEKFQPLLYGLGLLKTPAFARARLAAVEDELRVALAAGDGRKTVAAGDDWHKPKRVIVTFATEASMERTLQTFEVSAARRVFSNVTGIESSETPVDFEGTVLHVDVSTVLHVVDIQSGDILQSTRTRNHSGGSPTAIVVDGDEIYVSSYSTDDDGFSYDEDVVVLHLAGSEA